MIRSPPLVLIMNVRVPAIQATDSKTFTVPELLGPHFLGLELHSPYVLPNWCEISQDCDLTPKHGSLMFPYFDHLASWQGELAR